MQWLRWAQRIQAIAQIGLTYTRDPYDKERYEELRGLAVEIAAAHLGEPEEKVSVTFASESGYATPKVDVRAVVFRDGKLLLVQERQDGRWSLPGGWADIGESPGEMAVREVREETGYEVRPTKLLAVLDKAKHGHPPSLEYTYKLFIRCDFLGGEAATSIETGAVGFFGRDEIPPLSTHRVTANQIRRMFEHYDDPALPTDID